MPHTDSKPQPPAVKHTEDLASSEAEPPVVARMVVEIRSDGLKTVARGAIEDVASGQQVAVVARGTTPLGLATSLARSMFTAPALAGQLFRQVVKRRLGR